jgi:hypothetical protein
MTVGLFEWMSVSGPKVATMRLNRDEIMAQKTLPFSRTPALRLAERWLNDATKQIEVFVAETGSSEDFGDLRRLMRETRDMMGVPHGLSFDDETGLEELVRKQLVGGGFRPADVAGALWLLTPMGEMPVLALPDGEITELTFRSKAHVLVGLASCHDENPTATGFLYLSRPETCRFLNAVDGNDSAWLQTKNILPLDSWGLRALLGALGCHRATTERLGVVARVP